MKDKSIMVRHGFEVPVETSKAAIKVLKKLRNKGFLVFENDDGHSLLLREELKTIAGRINLPIKEDRYVLLIFTEKAWKKHKIKGWNLYN